MGTVIASGVDSGDKGVTLTNNVTVNPPGLTLNGLIAEVQKVVHEECGIALSREAALAILATRVQRSRTT